MNRNAGYSMFEVLVAFAVMSMVLAVLLPGQIQLLQRTDTAAQKALAQDYALSRLELARVTADWPSGQETYRSWAVSWAQDSENDKRILSITVTSRAGETLAQRSLTESEPDAE